ncbi:hypothetical protein [Ruegeria atlantica]|uniref:hypothetical protein n=1 Tax=Ruegeria atlantica TaxID=81569 RepID=UPI001F2B1001|nr:hypothetical protein [Ruegeria atlantica]
MDGNLNIRGKSATTFAAARESEIRYFGGTRIVGNGQQKMFDWPTIAYKHAFRRQQGKLCNEWLCHPPSNAHGPTDKRIRDPLGAWDGSGPEGERGLRKAMLSNFYENAFKQCVLR